MGHLLILPLLVITAFADAFGASTNYMFKNFYPQKMQPYIHSITDLEEDQHKSFANLTANQIIDLAIDNKQIDDNTIRQTVGEHVHDE